LPQAVKAQPVYTFPDIFASPLKSRGAPGVAVLDFDLDGDEDLYVTNGPGRSNALYANQLVESGAVSFLDVALGAGVDATDQDSTGVCYGDLDNDGDADLLVLGNAEADRLFENLGDGTFQEITGPSGVGGGGLTSSSCSVGDVDGDGLLDIAIGHTFNWDNQIPIFLEPFALNQSNRLLRNTGGLVFQDISAASGITAVHAGLPPGAPPNAGTITWAITLVDIDQDGDLDLVHADDQAAVPASFQGGIDRGYLQVFLNDGSGAFTNATYSHGLGLPGSWMGLAFADLDGDGRLDLFGSNTGNHAVVVFTGMAFNLADSRWFLQQAAGSFVDANALGGTFNTPFGWGAAAADYDNDGDADLMMHGGLDFGPFVQSTPGVILANDGAGTFHRDAVALAGSTDHNRRNVHGMAVGDLDGNGFTDIVSVANFDYPAPIPVLPSPMIGGEFDADAVFLPTFLPIAPGAWVWSGLEPPDGTLSVELSDGANGNSSAGIRLLGAVGLIPDGEVNRDGIGAVVGCTPHQGNTALYPVLGGSSYASQSSLEVLCGLGDAPHGTVEILWPGGTRNRLYNVHAGERLTLPEIPCSFEDPSLGRPQYIACVRDALDGLLAAGAVDEPLAGRLMGSAVRAFED